MEQEAITAYKFISGIIQPKTAIKSIAFGFWIFLYAIIGLSIYLAFIKPHYRPVPTSTQQQKAEKIINYYPPAIPAEKEKFFLGVKILGFRIGVIR